MGRSARSVLCLGTLAIVGLLAHAHATWVGRYDAFAMPRAGWTVAYAIALCASAYAFGLPDGHRTRPAVLRASVGAAFAGALAVSVVQLFVGDALLPRFVVFGAAVLLPDWFRLCTRLAAGGRLRAEQRDRVLLVGDVREVAALGLELLENPERPAVLVGSLTIDEARPDGLGQPLVQAADLSHPTVLVLDRAALADEAIVAQAGILHERGVRVRALTSFYEQWLGKLPVSELERAGLLFDIGELHRTGYGRAKRLVDLPLAAIGLVVLALVTPVVWTLNLVGNRGPLWFRQERVGKGGQPFTMLKFRTMTHDPIPVGEERIRDASTWTAQADPRVTRFGRFLRASHLDELPQVINVLAGDLAIVGPRPEQPGYVAELTDKLPFYRMRHLVRPGLTGWAQIKYGYAGDERAAIEKLQYEFWYLRHQSLATDLRIVGRTTRSILAGQGRGR